MEGKGLKHVLYITEKDLQSCTDGNGADTSSSALAVTRFPTHFMKCKPQHSFKNYFSPSEQKNSIQ